MDVLRFREKRLSLAAALAAALALAFFACLPPATAAKKPPDEVAMGKEAAAELEKQYKVLKDEALQARVDRIGQELAKIANDTEVPATYGSPDLVKFNYVFKVLDDKDVNALSMPGGFIYINKGLVDYAQSDDELAGVIAHEISHISHHHMLSLLKEQSKLNNQLAVALLAAILAKAPANDVGNVMMGARFVQIAKLNGYSRKAEGDADMAGLAYLAKSKYNPVGMLTFMERLARDELARPTIEWGVYQTHPFPGERSRDIVAALRKMDIAIDRRSVTRAAIAEVRQSDKNTDQFEVWVGGSVMFTPAAVGEQSSEDRAKALAEQLNRLLDGGLGLRDIRHVSEPPSITARGQLLLEVTDADAALKAPKSANEVAREAYSALYRVLLAQDLQQVY